MSAMLPFSLKTLPLRRLLWPVAAIPQCALALLLVLRLVGSSLLDDATLQEHFASEQGQCDSEATFFLQRRARSQEQSSWELTIRGDPAKPVHATAQRSAGLPPAPAAGGGGKATSADAAAAESEAVGDVAMPRGGLKADVAQEPAGGNTTAEEEASAAVAAAAKAASAGPRGRPEMEEVVQKAIRKVVAVQPSKRWQIWREVFDQRQAERQRSAVSCSLLPVGSAMAVMLASVFMLQRHASRNEVPQAARSVHLLVYAVMSMNYTIVILDSYHLCATLGLSEGDSGCMIGLYMLGSGAGAVLASLLVHQRPQLWRESPRVLILAGVASQLLGSVAYCSVSLKATDAAGKAADLPLVGIGKILFGLQGSHWLFRVLMASRAVSGFGSGVAQIVCINVMLHVTPVAERPEHTSRWIFAHMLGMGLGPTAAAAAQALDLCNRWPRFYLVGYVQVVAGMGLLAAVSLLHPSLAHVQDFLEPRQEAEEERAAGPPGRRTVICGCLGLTTLRAFCVSAIEVGIALELEKKYQWDHRLTGTVIGGIFLGCIPLKAIHTVLGRTMTVVGWIRVLSCISIFASLLFFDASCKFVTLGRGSGSCSYVLLTAGIVLFPCFFLSDALSCGLMYQHLLPEGSCFDANTTQLLTSVWQGLGRFLGAWIARLSLQRWGQEAFATEQLAITCTFLAGFEFIVRPSIAPHALAVGEKAAVTAASADRACG